MTAGDTIRLKLSSGPERDNCTLLESLPLDDPKVIGSLVPLGLICLIVTFGNLLVISAVRISSKLRGPTNTIIVSLAIADLLLGVLVLPLSAMYEVTDRWLFGKHLCFIWLSVDVWTCTASILHLVAISMDRYIAVTHPVTYPNIMTSKRTKLLIASVWAISFIICFPPLVGWGDSKGSNSTLMGLEEVENLTGAPIGPGDFFSPSNFSHQGLLIEEGTSGFVDDGMCNPQCKVNSDPGYVLFSAIGTFFAPMFVMIYFNWRIYRVASKTTKAIRRGFTQVRANGRDMGQMAIHRGKSISGGKSTRERLLGLDKERSSDFRVQGSDESRVSLEPSSRVPLTNNMHLHSNGTTSASMTSVTSIGNMGSMGNGHLKSSFSCAHHGHRRYFTEQGTQTAKTFRAREKRMEGSNGGSFNAGKQSGEGRMRRLYSKLRRKRGSSVNLPPSPTPSLSEEPSMQNAESTTSFTKRNIKTQVRKFRMETKAAKTIGIIVGCFVLCWLPFFTIYVIRAACVDCIPELLFSVFFWLGYCNSAINPVIYGLFSREFRAAFKRILCKFFCQTK